MKTVSRTQSKPNFFKFFVLFIIIMAITDGNAAGIAIPMLILFSILSSHKGRRSCHQSSERHIAPSREKPKTKSVSPKKKSQKTISKREMKKRYTKTHPIKMQKSRRGERVSHDETDWFDIRSWESDERPDAWADAYEPLNKKKLRRRRK